jgi:myo-inositol-1(or 4)-monophosphatase
MGWEKELAVAREASQDAGEKLERLLGRVRQIVRKGEIDLVTEADLDAEKAVVQTIRRHFPQDSILTEETGEYRALPERVWIVDPLDGTTNFVHNFPFYAVCIGLQVDGRLVLGLVYNPCMSERFEARENEGAFLNGLPIRVSQTKTLVESLVATGFPYSIHDDATTVIQRLHRVVTRVQGVRRAGSAALDVCYVAAGRFDAFWEEGLKPWDTAAASVIAREAGGLLSDYDGHPYSPFLKTVLASNGLIHGAMLEALRLD